MAKRRDETALDIKRRFMRDKEPDSLKIDMFDPGVNKINPEVGIETSSIQVDAQRQASAARLGLPYGGAGVERARMIGSIPSGDGLQDELGDMQNVIADARMTPTPAKTKLAVDTATHYPDADIYFPDGMIDNASRRTLRDINNLNDALEKSLITLDEHQERVVPRRKQLIATKKRRDARNAEADKWIALEKAEEKKTAIEDQIAQTPTGEDANPTVLAMQTRRLAAVDQTIRELKAPATEDPYAAYNAMTEAQKRVFEEGIREQARAAPGAGTPLGEVSEEDKAILGTTDTLDAEDAQKTAHFDAQDAAIAKDRKARFRAELSDLAKGDKERRARAPKGEAARKLVQEMRAKINAVTTAGAKGQNQKRDIRRKYERVLKGYAPSVDAVDATTKAVKGFLGNILGTDIDPSGGLATKVAADPVMKNLQTRATKLSKIIEGQGLTPKNAAAVRSLREITDNRIAAVSKAHREEAWAEADKIATKAAATKDKDLKADLKAQSEEIRDTQAAEEAGQARRALDDGDLQGAMNLANGALEAWPGSGSDVALRQIVTAVRAQRKAAEGKVEAEAKTAEKATAAAEKKIRTDEATRLEVGIEKFDDEIFNENRIIKDAKADQKELLGALLAVKSDVVKTKEYKEHTQDIRDAEARISGIRSSMTDLKTRIAEIETRAAIVDGGFAPSPPKPKKKGDKITREDAQKFTDFYGNRDVARQVAERFGWRF